MHVTHAHQIHLALITLLHFVTCTERQIQGVCFFNKYDET